MTSDTDIHDAALRLAHVFMTEQWMGSHVYKVGDPDVFKMFAILNPGKGELTIKTDSAETVDLLIEAGVARRNAHLPRGGWVQLDTSQMALDDIADRLATSHALCAATMTKAARKKFGLD